MNRLRWLPLFALLVLAVQGCEVALIGAGGAAALSAIEDRRTSGTQLDDESIEARTGSRIRDRFPNRDQVHVNVTSFNRAVLLTGEVPDAAARAEIEKIVYGIANVSGITNELQVAGVSSLSARANDSLITSKVKARFVDAATFNPVHVKVVTEASVVYLLGIVTETEAAQAVDIARTTGGVRKVVKMFEYCKPTDAICRPRANPPAGKAGAGA